MAGDWAKGVCPACQRVISGRAWPPGPPRADRRWVILMPHKKIRAGGSRKASVECLPKGGYLKVPRIRPDTVGDEAGPAPACLPASRRRQGPAEPGS